MERRFTVLLALVVAGIGGGLWWWLRPEPAAGPQDEAGFRDTGMSPEAREELMRSIGYVQQ